MDKFGDDIYRVLGPELDDFETGPATAGNCLGLGRV